MMNNRLDTISKTKIYSYKTVQIYLKIENQGDATLDFVIDDTTTTLTSGESYEGEINFGRLTVIPYGTTTVSIKAYDEYQDVNNLEIRKELENISESADPTKTKLYSESIFAMSNFPEKLAESLNCEVDDSALYGGSHIGTALAELCDEVYARSVSENSIPNSNDLTSWNANNATVTQERLSDGLLWNKIAAQQGASTGVINTDVAPYPTGATGAILTFDIYIPEDVTNLNDIKYFFQDRVELSVIPESSEQSITDFKNGLNRITVSINADDISWTENTGNEIWLFFYVNDKSEQEATTVYIRNVCLSWESPSTIQEYVSSGTSAISSSTEEWKKIGKVNNNESEITSISFGRNETSISPQSHYLAYDKLMSLAKRKNSIVIPTNPPAQYDTETETWADDDNYVDNGFDIFWKRLTKKWNSGVDINTEFRSQENAAELMIDAYHQSELGSAFMVELITSQINQRRILANAESELKNDVYYYIGGQLTGSWARVEVDSVEQRLVGTHESYCLETQTADDYALFENIECQQIHLLYRQGPSYSPIDVIIDEGTGNEQTIQLDATLTSDRLHAEFICDFGESGTHTVKVKCVNSEVMRIHGLVTI